MEPSLVKSSLAGATLWCQCHRNWTSYDADLVVEQDEVYFARI